MTLPCGLELCTCHAVSTWSALLHLPHMVCLTGLGNAAERQECQPLIDGINADLRRPVSASAAVTRLSPAEPWAIIKGQVSAKLYSAC